MSLSQGLCTMTQVVVVAEGGALNHSTPRPQLWSHDMSINIKLSRVKSLNSDLDQVIFYSVTASSHHQTVTKFWVQYFSRKILCVPLFLYYSDK